MLTRTEIERLAAGDPADPSYQRTERVIAETALGLVEWLEFYKRHAYLHWLGTRDELKEQLAMRDDSDAWLEGR